MYSYEYDIETGGLLLNSSPLEFSREPRPVYYKELDILGFDRYWNYEKNDTYPYMWAETSNYFYRGKKVAKINGGTLYTAPEIMPLEDPGDNVLRFVDIPGMVERNKEIMETLEHDTIKKIYNTYVDYKEKKKNRVDVFYVAFSGGKDSVVTLDLVQRALPHNEIIVLFGDTRMEFPDTYDVVDEIEELCKSKGILFKRAQSKLSPEETWKCFGPPAVTNRWCCSVHKTSPQIILLREITKKKDFKGMAFTGVRGDESLARNEYDDVNVGGKHQGQFSCHPILEWNSAELFIYIYENNLIINEAYKKGINRAGCLVCPMSSAKHEYMKNYCYHSEVERLVNKIKDTSGKTNFSESEMNKFIDWGLWKTRKSGRELNFGFDKHSVNIVGGKTTIFVSGLNEKWKEWAKTIGTFMEESEIRYTIDFQGTLYSIELNRDENGTTFSFPNCRGYKQDVKFLSLFRSVIIKSTYCINCGVCVAECTHGCIDMSHGLKILDDCCHCYQCHDIHEHCVRYNSIRNKIGEEKAMKGLGKYFSFGIRENWMRIYFKYNGGADFWDSDGDAVVANKKKDAFLNFIKDAGLVQLNKAIGHDKYTKYEVSEFGKKMIELGVDNKNMWALMLCNLVYTSDYNWFIKNIPFNEDVTPDQMKMQLENVMENDIKGLGKRNVTDAFKIMLIKTPMGEQLGLGVCDYDEKVNSSGSEIITLRSFRRQMWQSPEPRVILYSLFKFAEACGGYYSFTLGRLLNDGIDSDGISPVEIFGLGRKQMERLLNGLSVNYPEFINVSFTLDLDNITLRSDKVSNDVLTLF